MKSNDTILITGGAGYIGSHTVLALIEAGFTNFISVDNYANSSEATYNRIENITGFSCTYRYCELSDPKSIENLFREFPEITSCIHFAAHKSVPESILRPEEYYRNNINSLLNVLITGMKFNLTKLIFSSSCSVYGNIDSLPVNENTTLSAPQSPYASTKIIGEQIIHDFVKAHSFFKAISLRYFNPVGAHSSGKNGELPNQRPNNLVPVITQTAIGKMKEFSIFGNDYPTRDGTCIRDFVHVSDIAEAHVAALQYLFESEDKSYYNTFNLGSGKGVTVLEAVNAFSRVSGITPDYKIAPRRAGDVVAIYSDSAKAATELNWTAKRSLDEMMSSAWIWEKYCDEYVI